MIPTPGAAARLGLLVLLAVILQVSGFGELRVLGAGPDLVPLLVAAVALFAGALPAALAGFLAGLLLDLSVGSDLGASSLVLTAVGYATGRWCEVHRPAHGLAPLPLAAGTTAGYVAGFAAVSFMLEIDASVSPVVLRDMLVTTLWGALLALPAFALVRRVLRPALTVDPRAARRRRTPREAGPIGLRGLEV